ncbi:MAG: RdgB/HAM1 family non-canonical purine NTP pyrophosphatase [Erysipelotrichaceae bacterium]|nr:RdgB/HAM1 family non-canonical purine NTP pyrophosphatase [Erysipelotrichaceae bacterium]
MDIMIATGNKNKVREYKEMLEPLGFTVHDTSELTDYIEPVEDGTTFAENALIKARGVFDHVSMISIADDSGLSIRALDNEPGIHSARYMEGYGYPEKNRNLIERLKGCDDRFAWFTCDIALIDHNGQPHVFEGIMEGEIAYEPAGSNGFGYDPIFWLGQYGKTSAQLTPDQKNAISHRGQATRKLLEFLKKEYDNEE